MPTHPLPASWKRRRASFAVAALKPGSFRARFRRRRRSSGPPFRRRQLFCWSATHRNRWISRIPPFRQRMTVESYAPVRGYAEADASLRKRLPVPRCQISCFAGPERRFVTAEEPCASAPPRRRADCHHCFQYAARRQRRCCRPMVAARLSEPQGLISALGDVAGLRERPLCRTAADPCGGTPERSRVRRTQFKRQLSTSGSSLAALSGGGRSLRLLASRTSASLTGAAAAIVSRTTCSGARP